MERDTGKISDLRLEQYRLGELDPGLSEGIRRGVETDASLRDRLSEIGRSDEAARAAYEPAAMARAIRERARRARASAEGRRPARTIRFAVPALAMGLLALSFFLVRDGIPTGMENAATRLKGSPAHLAVFRKTAGGAEQLRDLAAARRGDVLQIGYQAAEDAFGVIVSLDGRGAVTFHLPANAQGNADQSPALDRRGEILLPFAYELDDAPSFERFFLISAPAPFETRDVERAVRALAAQADASTAVLSLPRGLRQSSLLLRKEWSR